MVKTFGHSHELTNHNLIIVLNVVRPTNKKKYKTLGTSVLNSPISPSSLVTYALCVIYIENDPE